MLRQEELEFVNLTADDVDDVFALYELALKRTSPGFLALRTKQDYVQLFAAADEVVADGVRDRERLIAYSLGGRISVNPYPSCRMLASINPKHERLYHGYGWVVHPDYRGKGIGPPLFRLRFQHLAARQVDHFLALSAVDNLQSIGSILKAGSILIGLAHDETALNYILYWGRFLGRLRKGMAPLVVPSFDRLEQERLFKQGYVICSDPESVSNQSAERHFGFWPMDS